MKRAFTLAEVLITLGIIGIVAALTMPTLIQNYQKQSFATQGAKFYSVINQAVRHSEVDNGSAKYWLSGVNINLPTSDACADYDSALNFYNKYFKNYLGTINVEPYVNTYHVSGDESDRTQTGLLVYLNDGSAMRMYIQGLGISITYFPQAKNAKKSWTDEQLGRYAFQFGFLYPSQSSKLFTSVEPFTLGWDGTHDNLISHSRYGCRVGSTKMYCTKLVQENGWKIPDNYPW